MRLPLFVFATIMAAALLFLIPGISNYALAVLAIGIGFQLSRVLGRHRVALEHGVSRSLPWMAGLVVLIAAGMAGVSRWREAKRTGSLAAAASGAPNVLLIILDTVRAANLSLYGYQRPTTPNLERFAAQGVRFERAFSTAPWTLPSHASLVTGHWPHELSADWIAALDRRHLTLAEYFGRQGYLTGGFVANVGYCAREFGLARGFAHYQDYPLTLATIIESSSLGRQFDRSFLLRRLVRSDQHLVRVDATTINGGLLRWLERKGNRPFFAMLNYYDAHGPYLPPAPYDTKFDPTGRDANFSLLHRFLARPRRTPPDSAVVTREIAQYDGALAYLDHELEQLFTELKSRGLLENTIILLTADHGEEFGEHGVFDHGNSLYRPSVQVPLVIVAPGRAPAGRVVSGPVSLRDVAHTLVDLAAGRENPFPGISFRQQWSDSAPVAEPVLSEVSKGIRTPAWYPVSRGDMTSLVADSLRYIRNGDGQEELYGLLTDPWEHRDLATSDSGGPALERLRQTLQASRQRR
jgi:arylsulfatase A-like enzyme